VESVGHVHYFDFGCGWRATNSLQLRFVVDNLFDHCAPNPAGAASGLNTDSALYDAFGRS